MSKPQNFGIDGEIITTDQAIELENLSAEFAEKESTLKSLEQIKTSKESNLESIGLEFDRTVDSLNETIEQLMLTSTDIADKIIPTNTIVTDKKDKTFVLVLLIAGFFWWRSRK